MLNVHLLQEGKIMRKLFFVMFLLSSTLIFAQNKVTGVVTDKSGMPLIGVNVVEKGTTNGNITDVDGKYSIDVQNGKTLVFSFIGFTPQEVKVTQRVINVVMSEDTQTLDEVVVVGYGSMQQPLPKAVTRMLLLLLRCAVRLPSVRELPKNLTT